MAQQKKTTALAVMNDFQIVSRYDGMTPEQREELEDQLSDLDQESGIACRKIKIPSGGGTAYEVQGEDEDDTDPMKTITGVVVFTHRLSGYWPNAYGSSNNPEDKLPTCASMDGKTGIVQIGDRSGEVITCETCPWNQYGTARDQAGNQARGKACKNMRRLYILMDGDPNLYLLTVPPTSIEDVNNRLYILMDGDPNLYLLTVPPTSIKDVNNQLAKIAPYADKVVTLSLEKATNAGGTPYSKVVVKRTGVLPPAAASVVSELRRQIKAQYQNMALTMDDYTAAPERGKAVDVSADDFDDEDTGFQEAPPHGDGDAPPPSGKEPLPFG